MGDRDCRGFRRTSCEGRGPNFLFIFPTCGKGHIPCLENVTEHPTPGAILEMRLDKETAATTDRGALSVWGTRTAQRGRAAETTHVSVTLSAPLTLTALAPRSVASESAGFEKRTGFHLLFHLKYMFSNLIQNTFERINSIPLHR